MALQTFTNTRYFSEAAIGFKRDGVYCKAPKGHPEYREFWAIQKQRCLFGYSVGDLSITGRHYFYLNFCPIKKAEVKRGSGNDEIASPLREIKGMQAKQLLFPNFWEVDYNWWWAKEIAMHGMLKEDVIKLQVEGLPIIDYLTGKHLACLKTRRAGFSYKEAADGVYNYNFIPNSISYYFAAKDDYLTKDGILNKVKLDLDHLNSNTQGFWLKNRMEKNTIMHQKASYLDKKRNPAGYMSEIIGVIVNDPEKVRGKDGIKVTYEEAGSFKNLKKAIEISAPSLKDGDIMTGQMSIFGCVCAGTEVYKANGERILIEDLKQEDGILGYNGRSISKEPITWMQPPAKKECVEITLESGLKLRCSNDHPIFCTLQKWKAKRKNARKVAYIPAEHITTDYMVGVIESLPFFGISKINEAYTLGYLLGDGYYGGTVEVIVDNQDSLNRIKSECTKIELKREYSDYLASYSIGGNIRQSLRLHGMFGQSKQTKRMPSDWKTFDQESLANLLAGYFDADGNVKNIKGRGVTICYSSVVKEILEELQEALLRFGVHSSICKELSKGGYTSSHTIYRLYIGRAKSVENFRLNIPVLNPNKQIPKQSKRIAQVLDKAKYHEAKPLGEDYEGRLLTGAILYKVKSVVNIGEQYIYNLTAGRTHSYLANNIITHNTGGEEGPDIEGLEDVFTTPAAWDILEFNNIWEEGMESTTCGYYVPCYMTYSSFMDEDGNIDKEGALDYDDKERDKKKLLKDPKQLDRRVAEYSRTPSEALQRLSKNIFPVAEILPWLRQLQINKDLTADVLHGILYQDAKTKRVQFKPEPDAKPIWNYPHNQEEDLSGCVTMYEPIITDRFGVAIEGLYDVVVDPYYKDQAEDLTSLWVAKLIMHKTKEHPEGDKVVAEYIGRPLSLETCYRNTYFLSELGNCKIQSEIAGGGQGLYVWLKSHGKLYKCHFAPTQFSTKENTNEKNRSIFMNLSGDEKLLGLSYYASWLMKPRGITPAGNIIYNFHMIRSIPDLQEIVKYNGIRNADRISTMIIAQFMFKEHIIEETKVARETHSDFFDRPGFTSEFGYGEQTISLDNLIL